jgi:hypothetical protein
LPFALKIQIVGVVDNAIQDSIAECRVRETHKPICHGDLSSDQGGDAAITIVEDLEQILGMRSSNGVAHSVIQDEQVEFGEAGEQGGVGTVLVRGGHLVDQA